MRVLVTGHQGYIGPILVKKLKKAGHFVTGLDVGYFRECVQEESLDCKPDKEIIKDLRDVDLRDMEHVDAIVHLAGLSNDPLGQLDLNLTAEINHRSSMVMARLAKDAGVSRFVFASSCSMYGASGGSGEPLDESAPLNPVSAYAVSKVKTENDLIALADSNFHPTFLRNSTAYGVSPRMRFDLVLNNLMGWAYSTGQVRVLSDGTPWRPIVHIEDISLAAVCALSAPTESIHNQAFNIGRDDSNYQVQEIAEMVAKTVPGAKLWITGETAGDPRSYKVDFRKAKSGLLGFRPEWTLEKGCDELYEWLRKGSLQDNHFDSRFYIRLKQLNHLMDNGIIDGHLRFVGPQSI